MYIPFAGIIAADAVNRADAGRITQNGRTMKVSDLTGALLDYWVAKAEQELGGKWHQEGDGSWARIGDMRIFRPSIYGEQSALIIDREKIDVMFFQSHNCWRAALDQNGFAFDSPTFLIAAMRAYIASKYGDEVPDIPPQN